MTERGPDGKFVKGKSGNPGGRPKSDLSITALIDAAATEADWLFIFEKLVRMARRGNLKAMEMLMDRRFGKPTQHIAGEGDKPIPIQFVEVVLPPEDSGDAS
jgi:hypothetical protein